VAVTSPARVLALETLRRVEEHDGHADAELGARLARARLGPQDRALATRLVYGTLAWQGRLDWHLAQLCTTAPERLDPWLRVILRLGLYQILLLDRVPDYAAVETAVALAHWFRRGAATGLVNATLRRAAAEAAALPLPDPRADPMHHLSVRWSHPRWLVDLWRLEIGEPDLESLLRADQEPAPTVLRVNTLLCDRTAVLRELEPAAARPTRYAPEGIDVGGPLALVPALPASWATVQAEASQLIAHFLDPRPGERILDACATPGGKATHLAALMRNRGEILAVDVSRRGLEAVERRAQALGIEIVRTHVGDTRRLARDLPAGAAFDRILVDAPCSGLGTLRGHPELRWRVRESDPARLARMQSEILDGAAPLCKPDGVLVYATCTLTRAENEAVVDRFQSAHAEFRVEDPPSLPPSIRPLVDASGALRTFPHRHGIDGFFAVRLRRRRAW
jgi:16S rRNA (cytosine967-C5)-methyltransferase